MADYFHHCTDIIIIFICTLIQVISQILLYTCALILGLVTQYLINGAVKESFIQSKETLLVSIQIEESNKEQVKWCLCDIIYKTLTHTYIHKDTHTHTQTHYVYIQIHIHMAYMSIVRVMACHWMYVCVYVCVCVCVSAFLHLSVRAFRFFCLR